MVLEQWGCSYPVYQPADEGAAGGPWPGDELWAPSGAIWLLSVNPGLNSKHPGCLCLPRDSSLDQGTWSLHAGRAGIVWGLLWPHEVFWAPTDISFPIAEENGTQCLPQ